MEYVFSLLLWHPSWRTLIGSIEYALSLLFCRTSLKDAVHVVFLLSSLFDRPSLKDVVHVVFVLSLLLCRPSLKDAAHVVYVCRAKYRLMPNSALLILWGGFTKIEFASDSRQKKNHHHYSIRSSQQWAFGEWKKFPWLNLANDGRVSKKKLHSGLNL